MLYSTTVRKLCVGRKVERYVPNFSVINGGGSWLLVYYRDYLCEGFKAGVFVRICQSEDIKCVF